MMMIVGLFNDVTSYYGHTASVWREEVDNTFAVIGLIVP